MKKPKGEMVQRKSRAKKAIATPGPAFRWPFLPADTVSLHVNFDVDMTDMARWQPGRIDRFFRGIAQILEARGVEEPAPDLLEGPAIKNEEK